MMTCIAAVDKNFGIGFNNTLLFHIPKDMKFFKETTMDHVVVMGRNTFESLGRKPLPNRTNIVITSKMDLKNLANNTNLFIGSMDDMHHIIKEYSDDHIYIIGGQKIYEQFIDKCDDLLLTQYGKYFDYVDTYFPKPWEHGFFFDMKIKEGTYNGNPYLIGEWIKK